MEIQTFLLSVGGGVIAFIAAWCYHIMSKQERSARDLWEALNAFKKEFGDYKLKVVEDFAPIERLEKHEERMVAAIEKLAEKLDDLVTEFRTHKYEAGK